jgi:hypothetical protein
MAVSTTRGMPVLRHNRPLSPLGTGMEANLIAVRVFLPLNLPIATVAEERVKKRFVPIADPTRIRN